MEDAKVVTESVVNVSITSSCNTFQSEKKFPKELTVATLKDKLELITGARSGTMRLEVYDAKDVKVCDMADNDSLLGSYPIDSGMRLHVVDTTPVHVDGDNLDNVAKFELTPEEYSKKEGTVQDYLRKNKMGKYNEEEVKKLEEEKAETARQEQMAADNIKLGDRCEVKVPGNPTRRGTVAYVGEVHFKPALWVGVKYDEPHGKNDGSVDGKRYFECQNKYGGFVKVASVTVGDFPEEDLGFSDDEI